MKDISNRTKILSQYLQNKNVFIEDEINSIINSVKWLYDSKNILIKYYKEYYKQMNIIEIMKLDDNQMKNYLMYIYESKMCKTDINNLYTITTEIWNIFIKSLSSLFLEIHGELLIDIDFEDINTYNNYINSFKSINSDDLLY